MKGNKLETKVVQQCKNENKSLSILVLKRLSFRGTILYKADASGQ